MEETAFVWLKRPEGPRRIAVNVVKSEYTFQPFRSKTPPRDPNRRDYCTVDLTKYLPKHPTMPRTHHVYMETIYYVRQNDGRRPSNPVVSTAPKRPRLDENDAEGSASPVAADEEKKKTKKKKAKKKKKTGGFGAGRNKKKKVIDGPDPPPPMPEDMKQMIENDMHGSGFTLLLQRELFESDLTTQQNRFSIPIAKLESTDFLSEEEQEEARRRDHRNHIVGLKVRLVDPKLDVYDFKSWDLATSSSFMITNKWSKVVASNSFRKEQLIQLWFFRDQENKPCFAITRV